jgi:hypothetical protein
LAAQKEKGVRQSKKNAAYIANAGGKLRNSVSPPSCARSKPQIHALLAAAVILLVPSRVLEPRH